MRKTIAGIIKKEITKTLNIIVKFIPIINPDSICTYFFQSQHNLENRKVQSKLDMKNLIRSNILNYPDTLSQEKLLFSL